MRIIHKHSQPDIFRHIEKDIERKSMETFYACEKLQPMTMQRPFTVVGSLGRKLAKNERVIFCAFSLEHAEPGEIIGACLTSKRGFIYRKREIVPTAVFPIEDLSEISFSKNSSEAYDVTIRFAAKTGLNAYTVHGCKYKTDPEEAWNEAIAGDEIASMYTLPKANELIEKSFNGNMDGCVSRARPYIEDCNIYRAQVPTMWQWLESMPFVLTGKGQDGKVADSSLVLFAGKNGLIPKSSIQYGAMSEFSAYMKKMKSAKDEHPEASCYISTVPVFRTNLNYEVVTLFVLNDDGSVNMDLLRQALPKMKNCVQERKREMALLFPYEAEHEAGYEEIATAIWDVLQVDVNYKFIRINMCAAQRRFA